MFDVIVRAMVKKSVYMFQNLERRNEVMFTVFGRSLYHQKSNFNTSVVVSEYSLTLSTETTLDSSSVPLRTIKLRVPVIYTKSCKIYNSVNLPVI